MEQMIKTITVEALDLFEDLSPNRCIRFTMPEFHLRVPVTYDPFSNNRTTDNEWVSEAMSYLGFEGTNYYSQVQDFINDLRERMKTDWAVAARALPKTDLNGDRVVNIEDIAIVAIAYGSHPDHPRWNTDADIDSNELVNIIDLSMVAVDFGKSFR